MIKDGGLSFETQLKIEFLPPNKKCLEKSLTGNKWVNILGERVNKSIIFSNICILLRYLLMNSVV